MPSSIPGTVGEQTEVPSIIVPNNLPHQVFQDQVFQDQEFQDHKLQGLAQKIYNEYIQQHQQNPVQQAQHDKSVILEEIENPNNDNIAEPASVDENTKGFLIQFLIYYINNKNPQPFNIVGFEISSKGRKSKKYDDIFNGITNLIPPDLNNEDFVSVIKVKENNNVYYKINVNVPIVLFIAKINLKINSISELRERINRERVNLVENVSIFRILDDVVGLPTNVKSNVTYVLI